MLRLIGTSLLMLSLVCLNDFALGQPQTKTRYGDSLEKLDVEGVRRALKEGADPNELTVAGMVVTPKSEGEIARYVRAMRAAGADVGVSALNRVISFTLIPAREGQVTRQFEEKIIAVLDVLFDAGATLQSSDKTILHVPAIKGARLVTKYLLDQGANPNGAGGSGNTPVILATEYGHPDIVSLLVEYGAQRLDPATEVQIRFISAVKRGDLIAMRGELARGAQVNGKNPAGGTALVEIINWGGPRNLGVVAELLRLGADPNLPGNTGVGLASPIHVAVDTSEEWFEYRDGPAIVEALLKAGAHVSSTRHQRVTDDKQTPLHVAARWQNAKAVKILLQAGAKVMSRDILGKTPLDYAESGPVIELLKAAGARE